MTLDDVYMDLLMVVSKAGTDISVPIESERFFAGLVGAFRGTREELLKFVEANLADWFKCVGAPPNWLQNSEWQFDDEAPMVFIGQLNAPHAAGCLHDDAAIFVFMNPKTGTVKTVLQVA